MNKNYHVPVMLNEAIEGLKIKPTGIYVDLTFGGGGHAKSILSHLKKGKLIAFDKDEDAVKNLPNDNRIILINHDFVYMENFLTYLGLVPVDGILADLGISSYQIDTPERGFSYRNEAPLDMRMDTSSKLTAEMIINQYEKQDLQKILGLYGEVKNARELANIIDQERNIKPIHSTKDLASVVEKAAKGPDKIPKYLSQVFQALRIEVNNELASLSAILEQSAKLLKKHGRLVIITYHSLEDRLVKNFINSGNIEGDVKKDLMGNFFKPFKSITKKPIQSSEEEIKNNTRARSAKLRIAEKV